MRTASSKKAKVVDHPERDRVIGHVLRYELYRYRDISDRIADLLKVDSDPGAFNRSTWDILYFLMQNYLQDEMPNVTDIYLATNMSKGTAISGLAELERRNAIRKVRDHSDGRQRRIAISDDVAALLNAFVDECGDRLGQPFALPTPASDKKLEESQGEPLVNLLNQLSHELRTPLTAIVGFSEMIADETLGPVHPAGYAEYARDIRRAASHLLDSLNELVDTTLAEKGVDIPLGVVNQVDMDELVDLACRATAGIAERRGIVLRRKWGTSKGRILGDKERLSQALNKLIAATVATAGKNQTVDVEASFDMQKGMLLRIISPEPPTAPASVDKSQPIGSPTLPSVAAVLPLVRAIAEDHGGEIVIRQESARRFVTMLRVPKDGPKTA